MNRRRARSHVGGLDDASTYDDSTHEGLKAQHRITKREVSDLQRKWTPAEADDVELIFHWSGEVSDFVAERNGPGKFVTGGILDRVEYVWDDDLTGAAGATIEWELGGVLLATHTSDADGDAVDMQSPYAGENIVATVTAVTAGAAGLTALLYLKPADA